MLISLSLSLAIVFLFLQTVITMINHAIGATGVVSHECRTVVQQYGQSILDLLVAEVTTNSYV